MNKIIKSEFLSKNSNILYEYNNNKVRSTNLFYIYYIIPIVFYYLTWKYEQNNE